MNMTSKDPLGKEIRAHVYTATIVHEPWRIVGIELHHDSKDVALLLTADEAEELGNALLKGAKELKAFSDTQSHLASAGMIAQHGG